MNRTLIQRTAIAIRTGMANIPLAGKKAKTGVKAGAYRYSAWMKKRPLLASCTSTCGIFTAGDALSQSVEFAIQKHQGKKVAASTNEGQLEAKKTFDFTRNMRFCAFGFFIAGPMYPWWFTYALPRIIPMSVATPSLVAKKVVCDMTLGSLIFDSASIFWMSIFKGRSPAESFNDIKEKFWTIYKADVACYAPFQIVNFTFVPNYLQPTSMALFSVVWSMVLSFLLK